MNKLKQYLTPNKSLTTENSKTTRYQNDKIEPEVGFKLILNCDTGSSSQNSIKQPELYVHLIGARHLPSNFGLKNVDGYMIRVKLFPGAAKYETSIKTTTWPKFDESFIFALGTELKSSMRIKNKKTQQQQDVNRNYEVLNIPEKLFMGKGYFVVFTVYALLDLPQVHSVIKEKYNNFKRHGSLMLKNKPIIGKFIMDDYNVESDKNKDKLTASESQRNIGSVTCFLDPKIFEENQRQNNFETEDLWMPIRDITTSQAIDRSISVTSSPKGQIEISLHLCDNSENQLFTEKQITPEENKNFSVEGPLSDDKITLRKTPDQKTHTPTNTRFSFSEMKKKIKNGKSKDHKNNDLHLKVTISRMRCSIKVKEQMEAASDKIYVKITIFQRNILVNSWKTDLFQPSLSLRWDTNQSNISAQLINENDLEDVTIKISVASKTKVGKKIVMGSLLMDSKMQGLKGQHWDKMIQSRNLPVIMWHSFE